MIFCVAQLSKPAKQSKNQKVSGTSPSLDTEMKENVWWDFIFT